ncbi:MAG: TetR family transcriptional regulator [Syntrophaceae bacterium]
MSGYSPDGRSETPQKLIDVAIELFGSNGFKGTSIRDIAKLTGMTISNIYYYFGNKDGLLLAILEYSSKRLLEKLRSAAARDLEPLDRLSELVRTHLSLAEVHKKEARIFFLDEEHLSPEGIKVNREFQFQILNLYRNELEILKSAGYIHYEHITILAFNILGVINWHLRWYIPGGKMTLEETNEEVLAFILRGALAPPR